MLFYTADANVAASEVARLTTAAGFDPVRTGGIDASMRIEVGSDLHAFGGFNGRIIDRKGS